MSLYGGIDSGSSTTEMVVVDEGKRIVGYQRTLTGGDIRSAGEEVLRRSLEEAGASLEDLRCVVATGYGRKSVSFAHRSVTEITCYAAGARFLDPLVATVIDIGGQDSKVISIDDEGRVLDFAMNDKCAAGTGRFLEMLARTFKLDLEDLGELSAKSRKPLKISSICAVFAESEMISLFSGGESKEDIIRAAHRAVAERVGNLLHRVGVREKVMFCGGVARNGGVVRQFEEMLGMEMALPEDVDRVGALGAALLALKS